MKAIFQDFTVFYGFSSGTHFLRANIADKKIKQLPFSNILMEVVKVLKLNYCFGRLEKIIDCHRARAPLKFAFSNSREVFCEGRGNAQAWEGCAIDKSWVKFKSVKSRGGGWFSSTLEGALKVDVTSSGVQRVSV
jgi:hypothetical protein